MTEANTPTANKTPFRRLGLARSIKKAGSFGRTDTPNTPTSTLISPGFDNNVLPECNPSPVSRQMRPIKSTCSDDTSDQEDNVDNPAPVTPININSNSKKTRLSLSHSWRNKIIMKKELQNIKRRKLMDDVEKCSEPEDTDNVVQQETKPSSALDTTPGECSTASKPTSHIQQQMEEVKESISIWRTGCVAALNDLQERRGTGNMESLLNMLQIPFEIVNFDRETQEFLDPD